MKPYFQSGGITLYHGDCREVLPTLGEVGLLVTDPPYGIGWRSGRRAVHGDFGAMVGDDSTSIGVEVIALVIKRNLRRYRHLYVFGPADFLKGLPLGATAELIWDKGNIGMKGMDLPWGTSHESIQFGIYVPEPYNRKRGDGRLSARMRHGSILRYSRCDGKTSRHPTEKPVPLLRELVESSSCFGEIVLDPFAGSGSTLVAALLEGRQAIGIEIEERYCAITARRIEAAQAQLTLAA